MSLYRHDDSWITFERDEPNHGLVTYWNNRDPGYGVMEDFSLSAPGIGVLDFRLDTTTNEVCSPLCPDTLSIVGSVPFGWTADVLFATVAEASVGYIHLVRESIEAPPIPTPLPAAGFLLAAAVAAIFVRRKL